MLKLVPLDFATARDFIRERHRHHCPTKSWKFGVGVVDASGELVGVAVAGRPVARGLDDGLTLEVTRCCTDGARNAPSRLYGAITRAAFALGYERVVTYTLASEAGASLRAAGFEDDGATKGGSWSCASRPREDRAPIEPKRRWLKKRQEAEKTS